MFPLLYTAENTIISQELKFQPRHHPSRTPLSSLTTLPSPHTRSRSCRKYFLDGVSAGAMAMGLIHTRDIYVHMTQIATSFRVFGPFRNRNGGFNHAENDGVHAIVVIIITSSPRPDPRSHAYLKRLLLQPFRDSREKHTLDHCEYRSHSGQRNEIHVPENHLYTAGRDDSQITPSPIVVVNLYL